MEVAHLLFLIIQCGPLLKAGQTRASLTILEHLPSHLLLRAVGGQQNVVVNVINKKGDFPFNALAVTPQGDINI